MKTRFIWTLLTHNAVSLGVLYSLPLVYISFYLLTSIFISNHVADSLAFLTTLSCANYPQTVTFSTDSEWALLCDWVAAGLRVVPTLPITSSFCQLPVTDDWPLKPRSKRGSGWGSTSPCNPPAPHARGFPSATRVGCFSVTSL